MFGPKPVVEIADGFLIRRMGWLHKKRMSFGDMEKVIAVSRDAVTHEETMVGFFDADGHEIWISEFDRDFSQAIEKMPGLLKGFIGLDGFVSEKPFDRLERVLWIKRSAQ
jgi:hypothetical protein